MQAALLVREQGEQSMAESERLREQLTIQQSTLTVQRESLVEREKQLVVVSIKPLTCCIHACTAFVTLG